MRQTQSKRTTSSTQAPAHDEEREQSFGQHAVPIAGLAVRRTVATAAQAKAGTPAARAGRPAATHQKLKNIINNLMHGADRVADHNLIGDGSTGDAVRYELANPGAHVGGRSHSQKARESVTALKNFSQRKDATQQDKAIAQSLIDDLEDALRTTPAAAVPAQAPAPAPAPAPQQPQAPAPQPQRSWAQIASGSNK